MRHKYSPEGIKGSRTYDTGEISAIIGAHPRTIRRWIALEKLPIIEGTESHFLIHGSVLRSFLWERIKRKKRSLMDDEFFCMKCGVPRKSKPECIKNVVTEKRIGRNKLSGIRSGICEVCSSHLNRFFTTIATPTRGLSDCVVSLDSVHPTIQFHDNI